MNNSNKMFIPFIATLAGALLMVLTLFFPYASIKGEARDFYESMDNGVVFEKSDVTIEDIMDPSPFTLAKLYAIEEYAEDDSPIYLAMIIAVGALSAITVLFALLKKPIAVIIFEILALGVFFFQGWAHTEDGLFRSIMGVSVYEQGAGYYIFFVAAAITFVGAIWLAIAKKAAKKAARYSF